MGVDHWENTTPAAGGCKPDVVEASDVWAPDLGDDKPFTGITTENLSKHNHDSGDGGCRNCGAHSHFARDCPDAPSMRGECYNCGEIGHNKADCPNPRVEREFAGTCRECNLPGHRAKDCPTKPPPKCNICNNEGHAAADCSVNRMFAEVKLNEMSAEDAWEALIAADAQKEVEAIRQAMIGYAKATEYLNFVDMEKAFRENQMNTFLIAKEQKTGEAHTIVDLQGKAGQKYAVSIQFSPTPRRAATAESWPASAQQNQERLVEGGFIMDSLVPLCHNCKHIGHTARSCPEEKQERVQLTANCRLCGQEGHYQRDCKEPRKEGGRECRHCGESHIAKECPSKEPDVCRNCGEGGHRAKECENERVMMCRNCDAHGHSARECPEPKNMSKVQCRNCDEMGHFSKECSKPTDWSRVECTNCHEKGHSYKRCSKPAAVEEGTDDTGGW